MTQEAHIAHLAVKHITGTLSEQENGELTQWLEASLENRQLFDQYTHPDFIGREYKNRAGRKERMEGRMAAFSSVGSSRSEFGTSSDQPVQSIVHRVHFLKTSWFRYAAAIILLVGGAATWYELSRSARNDVATTNDNKHLQTDIAPGGDKAILTLADGSKIVLDNAKNGSLAQQGNTKIIKLTNGQLAYNAGNALSKEMLYNTISTPRGGQYQITLPDGTKVWLNAASSIKFPATFASATRNVEMTGEAYMEVAKNLKQPFTVQANGSEIKVLGTSFNINAYEDEAAVKTTLIEGSVQVIDQQQKTVILKPGQQAVVKDKVPRSAQDDNIIVVQTADIDQTLAWKNGMFQFKAASIQEVMRQLSRWYDVEIMYEGKIPTTRFEGEMQRDLPLSSALRILELSNIHLKIEGKKVIVTP